MLFRSVKAFNEAEAYNGPALIIAYSHCINHGMNMETGMHNQKVAVESGHFPLYRFNPDNVAQGKNPLTIDSKPPTRNFAEQAGMENRFKMLAKMDPEGAYKMVAEADRSFKNKYELLQQIAAMSVPGGQAPQA